MVMKFRLEQYEYCYIKDTDPACLIEAIAEKEKERWACLSITSAGLGRFGVEEFTAFFKRPVIKRVP